MVTYLCNSPTSIIQNPLVQISYKSVWVKFSEGHGVFIELTVIQVAHVVIVFGILLHYQGSPV